MEAVENVFGADVDYAVLVKLEGDSVGKTADKRNVPAECTGIKKWWIEGNPNARDVSTPHVERHNLTMWMALRRFTRLTNAFSEKIANHPHMLSLNFVHYNFVCIPTPLQVTPAMTAGVTDTLNDKEWIVGLIDARAPKP